MAEVAVVGAGPAGISAAIQLARCGHSVTMFEKAKPGGALWNAGLVENYPGFPGGITGRHLAGLMVQHLREYVDCIVKEQVYSISRARDGFELNGREFRGVVVCTGTAPRKAGFPGEEELAAAGLLHHDLAWTEHWHERESACVVGGGEAGMDMALSLAETGMRVTLLHRSPLRGNRALMDAFLAEDTICRRRGTVERARRHGDKAVLSVGGEEMAFDMVLVAVGREACLPEMTGMAPGKMPQGIILAGDARRGKLGQAAMAVGDGLEAATRLDMWLRDEHEGD